MYGLVNKAVRDMVIGAHGEARWEEICVRAGCPADEFTPLKPYPDEWTYKIVGAASECLGQSPSELLEAFGAYWIRFTAEEGYGDLMDLFGSDMRSCLKNLNLMHARMGAMMPDLEPPRFSVVEVSSDEVRLDYSSRRQGLVPMVKGLLQGLAEKHGERVTIEALPQTQSGTVHPFRIVFHS